MTGPAGSGTAERRRGAGTGDGPSRRESGTGVLLATLALLALSWIVVPTAAAVQGGPGQAGELARQSLRPYGHVFVAYALAWALVLGWVVSLGRRWSRLEDELGRDDDG